jgi:cellobiose dehydrogenase (acceptor)
VNQPRGFRAADMRRALARTKEQIHWTDTPSTDGIKYLTNGTAIALDALTNASVPGHFRYVVANKDADRERTTSYTEFFFEGGEKGGPMATYLVDAAQRKTFTLRMNTSVTRVLRTGNIATGVEVESMGPGGMTGTINVTPRTGRVIISAGVFNTFKILLRSGIGPVENIQRLTANPSEAAKLPSRKDWLDVPAGANLDDGPNFNFAVYVPGVQHYPWEQLWSSSSENPDIKRYLQNRTGPLAQLQPSLGPVSWDTIMGADGRKRVVQWDCNSGQNKDLPGDGAYLQLQLSM